MSLFINVSASQSVNEGAVLSSWQLFHSQIQQFPECVDNLWGLFPSIGRSGVGTYPAVHRRQNVLNVSVASAAVLYHSFAQGADVRRTIYHVAQRHVTRFGGVGDAKVGARRHRASSAWRSIFQLTSIGNNAIILLITAASLETRTQSLIAVFAKLITK